MNKRPIICIAALIACAVATIAASLPVWADGEEQITVADPVDTVIVTDIATTVSTVTAEDPSVPETSLTTRLDPDSSISTQDTESVADSTDDGDLPVTELTTDYTTDEPVVGPEVTTEEVVQTTTTTAKTTTTKAPSSLNPVITNAAVSGESISLSTDDSGAVTTTTGGKGGSEGGQVTTRPADSDPNYGDDGETTGASTDISDSDNNESDVSVGTIIAACAIFAVITCVVIVIIKFLK